MGDVRAGPPHLADCRYAAISSVPPPRPPELPLPPSPPPTTPLPPRSQLPLPSFLPTPHASGGAST